MHPAPDDPTRDLAGTTIASLFSAAVSQPTPGGGCVTAICGYLGLSLLLKSIRVSSRQQTETAYAPVEKKLLALSERLLQAAQADSDSFAQFMKALQLPKDTEAEKTARQHAMHQAAVGATEAALNILDLGNEVLDCAHQVQFRVLPIIRADETACVELISAMNITARDNARTNLNGMEDAEALQRRLQQAVERYDSLLAACHSAR